MKEVWGTLNLQNIIDNVHLIGKSGADIIECLLCDLVDKIQYMDVVQVPEIFAVTCWYVWWQHRLIAKDEEVQTLIQTGLTIRAIYLNFVRAASKPATMPRVNRWRRPLLGQLSLNVDASFFGR